jgi:hypothetical protein
LWLVKHDSDGEVQDLASIIWNKLGLQISDDYYNNLHHLLANVIESTHVSAAKAIAAGILIHPNTAYESINNIKQLFLISVPPKQVKIEKSTKSTKIGAIEPVVEIIEDKLIHQRLAIAVTIASICEQSAIPIDNNELIFDLFDFIFLFGVVDISQQVRLMMIEAGRKLIDSYGMYLTILFYNVFSIYQLFIYILSIIFLYLSIILSISYLILSQLQFLLKVPIIVVKCLQLWR